MDQLQLLKSLRDDIAASIAIYSKKLAGAVEDAELYRGRIDKCKLAASVFDEKIAALESNAPAPTPEPAPGTTSRATTLPTAEDLDATTNDPGPSTKVQDGAPNDGLTPDPSATIADEEAPTAEVGEAPAAATSVMSKSGTLVHGQN